MNPASAFRGERAEARFERVLSVAGLVTLDVSAKAGVIRVRRAAPIYARSDSGSIRIKLPTQGGYTVRVRTDHGAIEIPELARSESSSKEVHGAIRGGGSIISAETDSGDIEITQ